MVEKTGTFLHESDDNFEQFLVKIGVSYFLRKVVLKVSPTVTITKPKPDTYHFVMKVPMKTIEMTVVLGQVAEFDGMMGPNTYILTEEDDTLIQTPSGDKPGNAKIVRKFTEDGMEMTFIHLQSGETGKRKFKRQI